MSFEIKATKSYVALVDFFFSETMWNSERPKSIDKDNFIAVQAFSQVKL